jgi:polo-like kinase 1
MIGIKYPRPSVQGTRSDVVNLNNIEFIKSTIKEITDAEIDRIYDNMLADQEKSISWSSFLYAAMDSEILNAENPKLKYVKDVVYVKKWMRTRHAIMFRLSNKVVQVNF